MHIRARLQHRRLQISVVHSRRTGGKVRQQHIASLGSVSPDMTAQDRLTFWQQVQGRLTRLGNRLDKATKAKLLDELRAKIPVPTEGEREAGEDKFASTVATLVRTGWSAGDIVRAIRLAELSENEIEEVVADTVRIFDRAQKAAINRVILKRRRSSHV
jgi:hypothetical protein